MRSVILRFLLIWLGIFVLLVLVSIIKNWDIISGMIRQSVAGFISGLMVIGMICGGIWMAIRSVGRR